MNDLQKHLTSVAIAAIRQEAGKIIADPETKISTFTIAESLDELEVAIRDLLTDQRFKAACDHVRAVTFRGGEPKFYNNPKKTDAPTPAENVANTGDGKSIA